jgi:hypothetical protein
MVFIKNIIQLTTKTERGKKHMSKAKWTLDSVKVYLTNNKGNEVVLNSGDLSDYTMNEIIDDMEKYVEGNGGELE